MSDEIKPALTPEEWAGKTIGFYFEGEGAKIDGDDLALKSDPAARSASLDPEHRHALAALCLYGQPFGFTREDVAMLSRLVPILQAFARDHRSEPAYDDAHAAFHHVPHLAARIAALLPPP